MKTLRTCIECDVAGDSGIVATPDNTLGMGNPDISHDNLSEPVPTAKSKIEKDKKKRKKKIKSLAESLFDDNITNDLTFGEMFKLKDIETKNELYRPGSMGRMIKMNANPVDMYKIRLISKDSGKKVNKDMESIANALAAIIEKIPLSEDSIKMSLYNFSRITCKPFHQYYSSNVGTGYLSMITDVIVHTPDSKRTDVSLMDVEEVDVDFLNIKLHYSKR